MEVSVRTPVNIALIKYWGKRNEELILPLNDSISISINALTATTTISIGPHISADFVSLNGETMELKAGSRFQRVFKEARAIVNSIEQRNLLFNDQDWHICVRSETNFPVAAGLASSAAGFAAIACGLGRALHFSEHDVVRLARIGSGSACRSVLGGFVHWRAGDADCAVLASASHWPQLRAIVIVLDEHKKAVGSSAGMRATVATSTLLTSRINDAVPRRVQELKEAISRRDFERLAQITMVESNQLHAICLDTFPPLNYLNADSHALIAFVHAFNAHLKKTGLAYTFDAGPNCCLILEADILSLVLDSLARCFRIDDVRIERYDLKQKGDEKDCVGQDSNCSIENSENVSETRAVDDSKMAQIGAESYSNHFSDKQEPFAWFPQRDLNVRQIICSRVGIGPVFLPLSSVVDGSPLRRLESTTGHRASSASSQSFAQSALVGTDVT